MPYAEIALISYASWSSSELKEGEEGFRMVGILFLFEK